MIHYSGTYTDQYELAMAQVYFLGGRKEDRAVFDYFFRRLPFDSAFAIFAGLHDLLKALEELKFNNEDLVYLREQRHDFAFLDYLKDFHFRGDVYSCEEGEVVFPNEPILRVEASIIEAQLIETLLLNILNFESLIATKAARVRHAAPDHTLLEFGLRRAQGPGGYYATRASIIGGFDGTSNVKAAQDMGLLASGTMAHSYVQSEVDELTAFRKFSQMRPEDSVLLLDTFSTLESGLPNAIKAAKEMETRGHRLKGVRLDSGDLCYLSKECRKALDEAGLAYVKIAASNQLDEYVIESLLQEGACIDVFGVGTKLVTGFPDAALDGVYKLSEVNGSPRIKLSETISKINLPHKKQIYRIMDKNGFFFGADAIALCDEKGPDFIHHPFEQQSSLAIGNYLKEPLMKLQMKQGRRLSTSPSINEIKKFAEARLSLLPGEYKRFKNPHNYKVGISDRLKTTRDQLVMQHHKRKT